MTGGGFCCCVSDQHGFCVGPRRTGTLEKFISEQECRYKGKRSLYSSGTVGTFLNYTEYLDLVQYNIRLCILVQWYRTVHSYS
jgi:hypothetical protein